MKSLLIAEYRDNNLLDGYQELMEFGSTVSQEQVMFAVGTNRALPAFPGKLYLADATKHGEYNPAVHRDLIKSVVEKEQPDIIVLLHSSYGWDLGPRVALALGATQVSEVVELRNGKPVVPLCNAKLRRAIKPCTKNYVATLQPGAFPPLEIDASPSEVIEITTDKTGNVQFHGFEAAEQGGVDLSKAEVIVSAGRGVGKPENVAIISDLAERLGGEYGASRPVVDAEWVDHNRQVGTTGQTVSPKLYVACGISGAIQHLAGMKKSEFVVAINTDKDAPIGEIADVLVVSDLKEFVPALMEKL